MIEATVADLIADFTVEHGRAPDGLEQWWLRRRVFKWLAQGTEARRAETIGSACDGPVAEGHAPKPRHISPKEA